MAGLNKDDFQTQYGFVFVHIPKTGGRSILSALGIHFHCQHLRMADYEKRLGAEVLARRFKFSIVRNPWDRAASWYRFFQFKSHTKENNESFDQWVVKAARHPRSPLDQFGFLRDGSGEIQLDKFLQFENLGEDYAKLREHLAFLPEKLPHIGGRESRPFGRCKLPETYQGFYQSKEAIEAVRECNRELIAKFSYTF